MFGFCCLTKLFTSLLTCSTIFYLLAFLVVISAIGLVILRLSTTPYPVIWIDPTERHYHDPRSDESHPLPQLGTILPSKSGSVTYSDLAPSTLYLSVIVPAYNEELRLPSMLKEAFEYLESRQFKYEIIVVDDGSLDGTTEVAMDFVRRFGSEKIRVISGVKNRGKGGAVRLGMLAARGEYLLFADADGATKFADVSKLEKFILDHLDLGLKLKSKNIKSSSTPSSFDPNQHPIAIASRAHLEKDSIAQRSLFRTILMYGFHSVVWLLTVRTVRDTQCGFKLFPRTIGHILFTHLHVERWAFDVELLVLSERLRLPIGEIPVRWTEIDGSKLVPIFSWLQMGKDVCLIFLRYAIGAHRYPEPPFNEIYAFAPPTTTTASAKTLKKIR